jgi:hypothetical protein
MAKSIALASVPSRLASLLLSYVLQVGAFVAPRHPDYGRQALLAAPDTHHDST